MATSWFSASPGGLLVAGAVLLALLLRPRDVERIDAGDAVGLAA
jgi:hypothetical protein